MEAHALHSPGSSPLAEGGQHSVAVTLQVTASDARRIVRALEETSFRLGGSPSGSRLASTYIRLASTVRQQTAAASPLELAG